MSREIKGLTAESARNLVQTKDTLELDNILEEIKKEALKSENVLGVYRPLQESTRIELKTRGFNVEAAPSISIQKDNFYYWVRW